MSGWALFWIMVGAASATRHFFRLVDWLENK